MPTGPPDTPQLAERRSGGLFGSKKRLEQENAQLRQWVERLGNPTSTGPR
ncbi:hypothetical protein ACIA8R_34905 [Nonomuraea sp. NPDC051191]